MDSNKNHIDNFLKEKLQDWPIELNEAHWADAERRLDEKDDRKKPFFFIFLLGVLLVGLGTSAYKQISSSKKSKPLANKEFSNTNNFKNTSIENYGKQVSMVEKTTEESQPSTESNFTNNSLGPSDSKTVKTNQVKTTVVSKLSKTRKAQRSKISGNAAPIAKQEAGKTGQKNVSNEILNEKNEKTVLSENGKVTLSNKKNTLLASANRGKKGESSRIIESKMKSQNSSAKSEKVALKKAMEKDGKDSNSHQTKPSGLLASAAGAAKRKGNSKITIYKSVEEFQEMNPRYVEGLENYSYKITNVELGPKKSDSLREVVAQQNSPKQTIKLQQESKAFVRQPSRFYILAGIAAARGYRGNLGANATYGFSPALGAGYQYNFTDRMSLYLSVYMSYIGNLNIKETRTQYSYSFDRDSTLLSVTRKNLLQLQLPVQVAYKLNRKHSLFGGIGTSLGINTISLYEDSKNSGSSQQFGYTDGLRFLDFNASLGYEYHLSPKFSAGIFYQQGFLDMTKNNYFDNGHFDRNSRGGINLRYKF